MPDIQQMFKEAWSNALAGVNAAEQEAEKVLTKLADAAGFSPDDVKRHAREFGERLTTQRREIEKAIDDAVRRTANRFRIPIYPISSGLNWGYGSRVPPQSGVLVDLRRLNRIVEFDEELAFVTIEPGVTQRQLQAFLEARGSRLWMDATGASPDHFSRRKTSMRKYKADSTRPTPMGATLLSHVGHVKWTNGRMDEWTNVEWVKRRAIETEANKAATALALRAIPKVRRVGET